MSELKAMTIYDAYWKANSVGEGTGIKVYLKDKADEAIKELNQAIDQLVGVKKSAEQILQNLLDCGLIKEWYFNGKFNVVLKADDPHLQIAELKKENESLKDKLRHYPMMAALIGSDNQEIRRLKRALWLARAECKRIRHHKYKRCLAMAKWCEMCHRELLTRACLPTKQNWNRHDEWRYFVNFWHRYEYRFRKLAEHFKKAK